MERWCSVAGVKPCPSSVCALARRVKRDQAVVRRMVLGIKLPQLTTLEGLARELRLPLGPLAEACLEARREFLERQAVERARLRAELED